MPVISPLSKPSSISAHLLSLSFSLDIRDNDWLFIVSCLPNAGNFACNCTKLDRKIFGNAPPPPVFCGDAAVDSSLMDGGDVVMVIGSRDPDGIGWAGGDGDGDDNGSCSICDSTESFGCG